MIKTLYQFAKLLKDEDSLRHYFSPAENPFEGRENKGKVLVGETEQGKFKAFLVEDFKPSFINKYLYRKPAGARGTNTVPTLIINRDHPEKTADKFVQSIENYNLTFLEQAEIDKVSAKIASHSFNKDFSYLLTFTIDGKYFGELDKYVQSFNDEAYNKYYKKNYGNSKQPQKLCALTNKVTTVYGFVDTLGFTVDADSFRRNGFNASSAYSMFPVSEAAISTLEGAKGIFLNKIAANFFSSLKYAILPQFVFLKSHDVGKEIAKTFLEKAAFNADSTDGGSQAFINDSESLLKEIIRDHDLKRSDVYYSIIFFEQQQAQFKIHSEINDLLPSKISKVLAAKQRAEEQYKIFTSYQTKDGNVVSQRITLFRLREYFTTDEKNVQPAYFKLLNSIFTSAPYDDSKLITLIVECWKHSFKRHFQNEENKFRAQVKNTLGNLYFLHLLGIFKKDETMNKENRPAEKQDALSFIASHPAYFTQEYLKGSFIFGCLVTRLLYNQPGNAFMKELHGLSIDKDLITRKFPKLIAKLRQYDKAFPDMEAAAQRCFAMNDKASKDEISFAFTMGLVLQKDFDKINKEASNQNPNGNE